MLPIALNAEKYRRYGLVVREKSCFCVIEFQLSCSS